MNIGAETTYRETSKIDGCTEWERRKVGINLSAGPVNAVEYCRLVYKMPNFEVMSRAFAEEHQLADRCIETKAA